MREIKTTRDSLCSQIWRQQWLLCLLRLRLLLCYPSLVSYLCPCFPAFDRLLGQEDLDAKDACDLIGHHDEEEPLETRHGDGYDQDAQTHICLAPVKCEEVVNIKAACWGEITYFVAAATTAVINSAKIANK